MIVFTLCSNNYLPYAGVLCRSLKQFHPEWRFILGLVDRRQERVRYDAFQFDDILPVEELAIPNFSRMIERYNIIEFNTAVKPFYFGHLFEAYPAERQILFFDPDIQIIDDLQDLSTSFLQADVLLTPHFNTPQANQPGIITQERRILQRGLYNLGFLGLRRSDTAEKLLCWWQKRLEEECQLGPEKGLFVDQKWMDLAPVYFDHVEVIKQRGYNVAYWNLYENDLRISGGQIFTGDVPLQFYHFSAFHLHDPDYVDMLANRFQGEKAEIIRRIYQGYRAALMELGYQDYRAMPYAYQVKVSFVRGIKKAIKQQIRRMVG